MAEALKHVWTPERSAAGKHNPWLVCIIVAIPVFMEVLDTAIANVSLRHIAGSLAAVMEESTWVITSYLVANAIIMPASGWLQEVMGRKTMYVVCSILFTVSSLLCGMATSLPMLVFFRILQGLGGGGLVPISQAMLVDMFPPNKRSMAMAIWGLAVIVSPVLGPPLGGWITETYNWRWIFLINVPVGIVSILLCVTFLHEPELLKKERLEHWKKGLNFDYIGFSLAAIGLGCLEVTLSKGENKDWFQSSMIRGFATMSALGLVAMTLWELRRKNPVVDVRLFKNHVYGASCTVMFCGMMVLFGSTTLLPMLLQSVHGYTAFTSGLAMSPGGLASAAGMVIVGILSRKVQLRWLVAFGLVTQVGSLLLMMGFTPNLTFEHAVWTRIAQSIGMGCIFIPVTTLSYEGLKGSQTNSATVLLNISRNVGGSFGIAITNSWLARGIQTYHSQLSENITPYNPIAMQYYENFRSTLGDQGAVMALDGMVNQQAAVMAFNHVFFLSAVVCAFVLLLVPILPKNDPRQGGGGGLH